MSVGVCVGVGVGVRVCEYMWVVWIKRHVKQTLSKDCAQIKQAIERDKIRRNTQRESITKSSGSATDNV